MFEPLLPTPSFERSPGPSGEGDSFGLQDGGSFLERAGFSRGFAATLRPRLPLRKDAEAPGRILSRRDSSSIALPAGQSWLGKTAGGPEEDRNPSLTDIDEAVDDIGDLPGRPYRRRIWAGLERRGDGGTHQERVESSEKLHPKVHPL